MALDVFAGPLCRYYADSPLDAVERMARQQQVPYTVIHGDRPGDGHAVQDVIRAAAAAWRDRLRQGIGDRVDEPLTWDESFSAPYWTEKPGWHGYGGALLLAAHDEHPELPLPGEISADWPDDPAYQAALAHPAGSRYDQLLTPELWLPVRFGFTFRTQDLTGQQVEVGSGVALLEQLRALAGRLPRDGDGDGEPDRDRDGGPGGPGHPDGERDGGPQPGGARTLAHTAARGIATLLRLAERAVTHRLPLRLDY